MDYATAGYVSREQVMDIVDWPDLRGTTDIALAPYRMIQRVLSDIKEHGKAAKPDAYMNLQLAYQLACQEVGLATLDNVKHDRVQMIRDFADETKAMMDDLTAQQSQAQQQAGMVAQQQMGTAAQAGQAQPPQPAPAQPPPQAQAA
jgi:hypothetical protein